MHLGLKQIFNKGSVSGKITKIEYVTENEQTLTLLSLAIVRDREERVALYGFHHELTFGDKIEAVLGRPVIKRSETIFDKQPAGDVKIRKQKNCWYGAKEWRKVL